MPTNLNAIEYCYLCGEELTPPISSDHVPPKQLYGKEIRKNNQTLNLLTIPTHLNCNSDFSLDEEYFVNTLVPLAKDSLAGQASLNDIFRKYHQTGANKRLVQKIHDQFKFQIGNIHIPKGLVAIHFESERIYRIAWKILRGLFFYNEQKILKANKNTFFRIIAPHEELPVTFIAGLGDKPVLGDHKEVFAYRFAQFPEFNGMWLWALCLWESIILCFAFHDLNCNCNQCISEL